MSYHCYADDTQLFLSFPPSDTQVSNRISACLRDIQNWMDNHHLNLNPGKTELIFFPALTSPFSDFSISLGEATVSLIPQCQEPRSGDGQQAVPLREHHSSDPDMQVLPVQHPANPSIPHNLHDPAPRPSNGPVPPGLLQLPASWPPGICHQTTTTDRECCGMPDFQRSQIYTHHPAAH